MNRPELAVAQSSEENAGGRPRLALALAPRSEKCHSREYKRDLANVLSRTEESIRWDEQERREITHQGARSSTEYPTCVDTSFFFFRASQENRREWEYQPASVMFSYDEEMYILLATTNQSINQSIAHYPSSSILHLLN